MINGKIWLSSPTMHGEELKYIQEAFDSNWVAPLGPNVDAFEKEMASYIGIGYAAALVSGTSALHLAVKLAGVKPGDIVFCSDLTFSATVNESLYGEKIYNYNVLGTCEWLRKNKDVYVVCAIGSANIRKKIISKVSEIGCINYATLVDPTVITSDSNRVGNGSIICANTVMTVNVSIGNHVIINLDCTIGHESVISDYVTLYPSVNVSGSCRVDEYVEIGTGANIIQNVKIYSRSIIGAGAVVVRDITVPGTYVGIPARLIE